MHACFLAYCYFWCFILPRAELPRHTVIVLSVCLSVCYKHFSVARWKLSAETSRIQADIDVCSNLHWQNFCSQKVEFVMLQWRDLLTLIALLAIQDFFWRQNCLHVTAWQLTGSIGTTDSTAVPEKLCQRAMMAKPTAISLVCWYCCDAQLINTLLGFCVCYNS